MKKIEKYKNDITDGIRMCELYQSIYKIKNGEYDNDCSGNCNKCYDGCIRWLVEEFEEPVLDEVEREYLSALIKPFRKNVLYISKIEKAYEEDTCFIDIELNGCERINLPYFNIKSGMYAGMQPFVKYSLKELGL